MFFADGESLAASKSFSNVSLETVVGSKLRLDLRFWIASKTSIPNNVVD